MKTAALNRTKIGDERIFKKRQVQVKIFYKMISLAVKMVIIVMLLVIILVPRQKTKNI